MSTAFSFKEEPFEFDREFESEWEETIEPEIATLAGEALEGWLGEWEGGRDASLAAIAERIAARRPIRVSAMEFENENPALRWTRCFKVVDVRRVRKAYQDNAKAAGANSVDRCSCIVMLNVALGQLLKLKTKENPARSKSTRKVQMGALTTKKIEKAMAQLRRAGYASPAITIDFFDRRNKTAGTLKPERLQKSVQKAVLDLSTVKGCWYAYGLSIMDGYHSVLLLVDKTGKDGKIYWLDQFSSDINDEVTTTLDQRITTKTQDWWQAVKDEKNVGYNTPARVWPLRKLFSSGFEALDMDVESAAYLGEEEEFPASRLPARARATVTQGALAKKTPFRYVKDFSGPSAECADALKRAGKTRAQALTIINAQIGVAIAMLRKAATDLKRGSRSSKTKTLFHKIFRVRTEFVPAWLKPTDTIKDRGDVVATRCKRVADLLASGTLKFFCTINSTNCPDCSNDSSDFACSSWGDESKAPRNSNVICLGDAFWDDMKAGKTNSLLATLMHEPFHIYYGKYVTEHDPGRGKFGGINCIVRFVFETNGRVAPDRVNQRCTNTLVRKEVSAFLS